MDRTAMSALQKVSKIAPRAQARQSKWPRQRSGPARNVFPELEPADLVPPPQPVEAHDERGEWLPHVSFHANSVHDEQTRFLLRDETEDPIARLTVYAVNATILFFAFPVGFGLLIFNILGGENLRTTAHALALTGMGTALTTAATAATLF